MFDATRWVVRVVQGDRHPVHGNDFKRLPLKLQVEVTIRRGIHNTPKLALTRSDFNLRPHRSVYREDLFRYLWLRTANIRTEFNALLQNGRLRVIHNGTAAYNQDAVEHADQGSKIRFNTFNTNRSGDAVIVMSVTLS